MPVRRALGSQLAARPYSRRERSVRYLRGFPVGGGPSAIELITAGNAAVWLRILCRRQPLCRRMQVIRVGKPVPRVALVIERLAQDKFRMTAHPDAVAHSAFRFHQHMAANCKNRQYTIGTAPTVPCRARRTITGVNGSLAWLDTEI
jgi:hypothetical protein